MYVIFDTHEKTDLIMSCFYEDETKQREMMHRLDEDQQVKEWQKLHTGNPPRFTSRLNIKKFTNENISNWNVKKI